MAKIKLIGYCKTCEHTFHPKVQNYECPYCHHEEITYERELECECGETFPITDPLTNECPKCSRLYNSFGQELNPDEAYGDGKVY